PTVAGHVEVPGFSTHLEPRGDRLIAVGIDDTDGNRPAVSYYDVHDPANPTEIGRIVLGPPGSFTESQAVYDDKAFEVIDALGLIAIPFRHVDVSTLPTPVPVSGGPIAMDSSGESVAADQTPKCMNGVQLIDFNDSGLSKRGFFEQHGQVE